MICGLSSPRRSTDCGARGPMLASTPLAADPPARSRHDAAAPPRRLAGKVAIVTGGAAGIGFAYARRFLAEGARVVLADVADPVAAAEKLGAGGDALGVPTDVSDAAAVRAMVDAAVARFGRVDVLVNNAAVFATLVPRPFDEIPES